MHATCRPSVLGLTLLAFAACGPAADVRGARAGAVDSPAAPPGCPRSAFDPRQPLGRHSSMVEVAGGLTLHSVACGSGDRSVVFLHGQPTSAFLWREVAPAVSEVAGVRTLALDLPGFGRSTAPAGTDFAIETHEAALDDFLRSLGPEPVVLVGHDWGSYLALGWAERNPERVAGLVMMEAILPVGLTRPERVDSLTARADSAVGTIWAMAGQSRSRPGLTDDEVADLALGEFLELGTLRTLTADEWDAYRRPFATGHRAPIVALPRQIPRDYALDRVRGYASWLGTTDIPALFLFASPGLLGNAAQREWVRSTLADVTLVDLGPGIHFLQEDHGPAIGSAIADWVARLPG